MRRCEVDFRDCVWCWFLAIPSASKRSRRCWPLPEFAGSGERHQGPRGADPDSRVLLVDTVGELGAWWGTPHIAFVGGSIHKRGGQNMLEPAAYGSAISFGPNTRELS